MSLKGKKEASPQVNEKIGAGRVQLITHEGENIGVTPTDRALRMARDVGLDLVVIAEQGKEGVPIAKIMDFGKNLYEKKKQQTEAKKHQKMIQVKEIKLRPKIGEHDYLTKLKQMFQFLEEGKRVKVTLFFRGREIATKQSRGMELFGRIQKAFEEQDLVKNLIQEEDANAGPVWSRVYYLKNIK
jgi:translation initiation factor IF-3